jgi:hypothetical protein
MRAALCHTVSGQAPAAGALLLIGTQRAIRNRREIKTGIGVQAVAVPMFKG